MANKDSYYSRSKYRKKYDLHIGFLFSIFVMLLLLGVMYLVSPHDQYFTTAMELQFPIEMGKAEDMMQPRQQQLSAPPVGLSPPEISLVDEIATKVMDNSNILKDTTKTEKKDTLLNKLTGSGGAKTTGEADVEEATPFAIIEEKPLYPGGPEAMAKFLKDNLKYPHLAKEAGISGVLIINFLIDKDGAVTNVKVVRGLGGGCNEEAVRVVSMMPKWAPGRQRGKAAKVYFQIPLIFGLRPN
jgi:protein TonB